MKMEIAVIHCRKPERDQVVRQIQDLNDKNLKVKKYSQVIKVSDEDRQFVNSYFDKKIPEEELETRCKNNENLKYYYRMERYNQSLPQWKNFTWKNLYNYYMDLEGVGLVILHDSNNFSRKFYKKKLAGKKIVTIIVSNASPTTDVYNGKKEPGEYLFGCCLQGQFYLKEFLEDWITNGDENEKIFGKGIRWDFEVLKKGKNAGAEDILGALNILGMQLTKYFNLLRKENSAIPLSDKKRHPRLDVKRLFRPHGKKITKKGGTLEDASSAAEAGWYWFDYCLRDAGQYDFDTLANENPELNKCPSLRTLWQILRGECLNLEDGILLREACPEWERQQYEEFFQKGLHQYRKVCDKSVNVKKIDNFRTYLNHSLLMNGFFYYLGNNRPDATPEENYSDLFNAWQYLKRKNGLIRDDNGRILNGAKLRRIHAKIQKGLATWDDIEKQLDIFFGELPGQCRFKVTGEFERIRQEVTGWRTVISETVCQYRHPGNLPEQEKDIRRQLAEFITTIQHIHTALSRMKLSKSFDTYFEYIITI